jgi:hypothetical protein
VATPREGKEHVMIVPGRLDCVAVRAPHRADASARRRRERKGSKSRGLRPGGRRVEDDVDRN